MSIEKGKKRSSTLLFYMKFIFLPAELLIAIEWRYIHFDTVLRCADDSMLWAFRFRSASKHFFLSFRHQMQSNDIHRCWFLFLVLWCTLALSRLWTRSLYAHSLLIYINPNFNRSPALPLALPLCLCHCLCLCYCLCLCHCLYHRFCLFCCL